MVTRLTLRTHELPKYLGVAGGRIKASSDDAFRQLIGHFIAFYREKLFNGHWGENIEIQPDNTLDIGMACEGLDAAEIVQIWQPFLDWVRARPNDFSLPGPLRSGAGDGRTRWSPSNCGFKHDPRVRAPAHHVWYRDNEGECGAYLYAYDSVWLPASGFPRPAMDMEKVRARARNRDGGCRAA